MFRVAAAPLAKSIQQFRNSNCYQYLTCQVLAASGCNNWYGSQSTAMSSKNGPKRPINIKNRVPLCPLSNNDSIWLTSTKSSLWVPDSATPWFRKQLNTPLKPSLAERCKSFNVSTAHILTPDEYMNVKPNLRTPRKPRRLDPKNYKRISPEFFQLLKKNDDILSKQNPLHNVPGRLVRYPRKPKINGRKQFVDVAVNTEPCGDGHRILTSNSTVICRSDNKYSQDPKAHKEIANSKIDDCLYRSKMEKGVVAHGYQGRLRRERIINQKAAVLASQDSYDICEPLRAHQEDCVAIAKASAGGEASSQFECAMQTTPYPTAQTKTYDCSRPELYNQIADHIPSRSLPEHVAEHSCGTVSEEMPTEADCLNQNAHRSRQCCCDTENTRVFERSRKFFFDKDKSTRGRSSSSVKYACDCGVERRASLKRSQSQAAQEDRSQLSIKCTRPAEPPTRPPKPIQSKTPVQKCDQKPYLWWSRLRKPGAPPDRHLSVGHCNKSETYAHGTTARLECKTSSASCKSMRSRTKLDHRSDSETCLQREAKRKSSSCSCLSLSNPRIGHNLCRITWACPGRKRREPSGMRQEKKSDKCVRLSGHKPTECRCYLAAARPKRNRLSTCQCKMTISQPKLACNVHSGKDGDKWPDSKRHKSALSSCKMPCSYPRSGHNICTEKNMNMQRHSKRANSSDACASRRSYPKSGHSVNSEACEESRTKRHCCSPSASRISISFCPKSDDKGNSKKCMRKKPSNKRRDSSSYSRRAISSCPKCGHIVNSETSMRKETSTKRRCSSSDSRISISSCLKSDHSVNGETYIHKKARLSGPKSGHSEQSKATVYTQARLKCSSTLDSGKSTSQLDQSIQERDAYKKACNNRDKSKTRSPSSRRSSVRKSSSSCKSIPSYPRLGHSTVREVKACQQRSTPSSCPGKSTTVYPGVGHTEALPDRNVKCKSRQINIRFTPCFRKSEKISTCTDSSASVSSKQQPCKKTGDTAVPRRQRKICKPPVREIWMKPNSTQMRYSQTSMSPCSTLDSKARESERSDHSVYQKDQCEKQYSVLQQAQVRKPKTQNDYTGEDGNICEEYRMYDRRRQLERHRAEECDEHKDKTSSDKKQQPLEEKSRKCENYDPCSAEQRNYTKLKVHGFSDCVNSDNDTETEVIKPPPENSYQTDASDYDRNMVASNQTADSNERNRRLIDRRPKPTPRRLLPQCVPYYSEADNENSSCDDLIQAKPTPQQRPKLEKQRSLAYDITEPCSTNTYRACAWCAKYEEREATNQQRSQRLKEERRRKRCECDRAKKKHSGSRGRSPVTFRDASRPPLHEPKRDFCKAYDKQLPPISKYQYKERNVRDASACSKLSSRHSGVFCKPPRDHREQDRSCNRKRKPKSYCCDRYNNENETLKPLKISVDSERHRRVNRIKQSMSFSDTEQRPDYVLGQRSRKRRTCKDLNYL